MSYPWWHIQATFQDGTTVQYNSTAMTARYALEVLLVTSGMDDQAHLLDEKEREHGDLVKLEVLHPSTPGLDPATELCPGCAHPADCECHHCEEARHANNDYGWNMESRQPPSPTSTG